MTQITTLENVMHVLLMSRNHYERINLLTQDVNILLPGRKEKHLNEEMLSFFVLARRKRALDMNHCSNMALSAPAWKRLLYMGLKLQGCDR